MPLDLYPRYAESHLLEALEDSPVVLIHGPRQCGKSTLARTVGTPRGYDYITFDDNATRDAAAFDPVGFVDSLPDRIILDEVQRVPSIFTALKQVVDRDRAPGRFILTGSANVLLVPALADSLAGRMEILRLYPLAQCELARNKPNFLDLLFTADFKTGTTERLRDELAHRIAAGGYPPALARPAGRRRNTWYRDYLETMIQRDVKDFSRISSLETLPRLLSAIAAQTAQLLNISALSSPFQLTRPTIADYVTLLQRVFLVEVLNPWHTNRMSRLVKTPKIHIGDTGLACTLLGLAADDLLEDRSSLGPLLETFVYQELRRQAGWHDATITFHHLRDKDGVEVDLVLEKGIRSIAGVEVKAASSVSPKDFRGLKKMRDALGKRFKAGVVLYEGENTVPFGDRMFAVPVRSLWEL